MRRILSVRIIVIIGINCKDVCLTQTRYALRAFLNRQLVPLVKGESEWNEQGGLGILPSFSCENATFLFKDGKVAGGR